MATGLIYKPGSGPCAETTVSVTGSCVGFKIPRVAVPEFSWAPARGPGRCPSCCWSFASSWAVVPVEELSGHTKGLEQGPSVLKSPPSDARGGSVGDGFTWAPAHPPVPAPLRTAVGVLAAGPGGLPGGGPGVVSQASSRGATT